MFHAIAGIQAAENRGLGDGILWLHVPPWVLKIMKEAHRTSYFTHSAKFRSKILHRKPPEGHPNLVSTIPRRGAPVIVQYRSDREAAQEMLKSHLSPPGGGDAIHSQRAVGRASPFPSRSHVWWRVSRMLGPCTELLEVLAWRSEDHEYSKFWQKEQKVMSP